jgi:hypothetical protein
MPHQTRMAEWRAQTETWVFQEAQYDATWFHARELTALARQARRSARPMPGGANVFVFPASGAAGRTPDGPLSATVGVNPPFAYSGRSAM